MSRPSLKQTLKHSLQAATASTALLLLTSTPSPAVTFTPATEIDSYTTSIGDNPTDIYFPTSATDDLPVALMLQGALVDKADYANYAKTVASYGFAVVVPNNERTLIGPAGPVTGLFPEQGQVQDTLDFMTQQNQADTSPLSGLLDTESLGLLGHSFGGAAGTAAVQNLCLFPLCTDESYEVPEELKAGIFYGTNFNLPEVGTPPIDNQVPTGYIYGTRDGVTEPALTVETFEQTLNPPKALIEVDGANHYGITNEDSPRDPVRPTLDQAIATETIGRWSGLFLRAHVLEDEAAFNALYGENAGALDPVVTIQAVAPDDAVKTPEPSTLLGLVGAIALLQTRRLSSARSPKRHQTQIH